MLHLAQSLAIVEDKEDGDEEEDLIKPINLEEFRNASGLVEKKYDCEH